MGRSTARELAQRAVAGTAVVAMVLGLGACGSNVPKEQHLADSRGGDVVTQTGQTSDGPPVAAAPAAPNASAPSAAQNPVAAPAQVSGGAGPAADGRTGAGTASTNEAGAKTRPKGEGTAAAAAQPRCTGPLSTIAIGTVGGMSGFIGAVMRPGVDAIKAWVADTNAKGGLACHPIRYHVADDGGDPARNAALTEQMVSEHKVVAMLFSSNPLSAQGGKPVLERAHVPTIGNEGASEHFYTSPDFFPVSPSGVKMIQAQYGMAGQQLTPEQRSHFGALVCIEVALCSQFGGETGAQVAKEAGMTMIYNTAATMVAPDYTSNCQGAKEAGVQALMLAGDNGLISRAIRSCNKIGFQPVYVTSPIAITSGAVELPELQGVVVSSVVRPWTANDPQAKRYVATLEKYIPGALPAGAGAVGWACALVFEKAAANLPASPTPQDVYTGLWTIKNNDFGGYTAPLTYTKERLHTHPVCWWAMEIRDKGWITLNNGTRTCKK